MKLINCDLSVFVNTFGVEGVSLVGNHNVDIYLLNEPTAAALGLGEAAAMTAGNWGRKEGESCAIMFFNVDRIISSIDGLQRNVKGAQEKVLRSFLVHELTHVKQIEEGRMGMINGKITWEGKVYNHKNDGSSEYFSSPWEKEAYLAQFTYQCAGNVKEAKSMVKNLSKAA